MKYVWVDSGNDPQWEKIQAHGINGLYFAITDPRVTRTYLQDVAKQVQHVGVYAVSNWPEFTNLNPEQQAEELHRRVKAVSWTNINRPKVQWDDERHQPDTIIRVLERFRALQPTRDFSWTLEGMQGGWMSAAFTQRVVAARVRVVPQCYNGDMTQVWDTLACARDLTRRGIPDTSISPFYDAARLPYLWDGFAFTMGRLP